MGSDKEFRKVQVWIFRRLPNSSPHAIEVLLLHTIPKRGSFWQPITGGVEPSETYPEAALREAFEETGLELTAPLIDLEYEFEFMGLDQKLRRERVYALECMSPEEIRISEHEHDSYEWVSVSDARKKLIYPSNSTGLEKLIRAVAR